MSDLHELCYLKNRPIRYDYYVPELKKLLRSGIPATYTLEEVYNYENNIDSDPQSTTTPIHLICESIPLNATEEESNVILEMMDELWLNGAGWCLTNDKDETPGCVLLRRGLNGSKYWENIVDSGVRAEVLLRKLQDPNVEFFSDDEIEGNNLEQNEEGIPDLVDERKDEEFRRKVEEFRKELHDDPSNTTDTYLKTKLEYKNGALVTEGRSDGVMMQWEDTLMKAGCDSLFKSVQDREEVNVLNIGFGMGIIDTMIQTKNPTKHYISEAHPDVLSKMKRDGWYERDNVVILEGKWQDTLPQLLTQGIFFDGIYYDTYSEHYEDMVNDLFDVVVGLLKPQGIFSFFNGMGADRLICYEVYKKVVDIDLSNYGLTVKFKEITAPKATLEKNDKKNDSVWKDIKRAYWRCPVYYHPEASFM